jgi:TDP-4-oxo-6-deoxy-alpha-D-glucose-3,4-oxoisomerase
MSTHDTPAPWRIVALPTNTDARGSITICESGAQVPFTMQRARWVYGAPPGATRGGHAHHRTSQLFVAIAGALTVAVDDTRRKERIRLDTPARGLLIPPDVWIETTDWTDGAVLLMLASERHDPADYIRDYGEFAGSARDRER